MCGSSAVRVAGNRVGLQRDGVNRAGREARRGGLRVRAPDLSARSLRCARTAHGNGLCVIVSQRQRLVGERAAVGGRRREAERVLCGMHTLAIGRGDGGVRRVATSRVIAQAGRRLIRGRGREIRRPMSERLGAEAPAGGRLIRMAARAVHLRPLHVQLFALVEIDGDE